MRYGSRTEGEKYQKAKEWKIPVINHLWLEACLLRWALVDVFDDTAFSEFPLDLFEKVGRIPSPYTFKDALMTRNCLLESTTQKRPSAELNLER
jgi:hypothetical protein